MLSLRAFEELSVCELLDNVRCYSLLMPDSSIRKELYCILEVYLEWNIKILFSRWPKSFPNIVFVLEQIQENGPFFDPGSTHNTQNQSIIIIID